ncbi:MAG TPA: HNH endonuclease signature motif containing protein [Acidimicrobiales bacterium]|jgi:hypothetical protein|nr:HNH endonuclease signature motif containing protein [Acidimicrobiales bacterium]
MRITYNAALGELDSAVAKLRRVVRDLDPAELSGDQARTVIERYGVVERVTASGVARLSPRVIESGSYAKTGSASAAEWLGSVTGTSAGMAKGRLAAAERAAATPELAEALRDGELSSAELKAVAQTAAVAPECLDELLPLTGRGSSVQELTERARCIARAARSKENEQARRIRVHKNRHLRWHQDPEGGIRGEFSCDEVEWATVSVPLEAEARARWKLAGASTGESLEAYRLDAFLDLLVRSRPSSDSSGSSGSSGSRGSEGADASARPHFLILLDAEALRRGQASKDELCEIDGVGPVSVDAVTELIGEANLQFLIRDGKDIRTVTSVTRNRRQRTEMALIARDRSCGVPECPKRRGLEADHCGIDYRHDGPTDIENLVRLCPPHHAMKTYGGWRLIGPTGRKRWVPPAQPLSAQQINRARKVEAARGKANRIRD